LPRPIPGNRQSAARTSLNGRMTRLIASPSFKRRAPIVLAFLIGLLPSIYFYNQSKHASESTAPPSPSSLQSTTNVVNAVARHIVLPSGEQPTVATVSDASKVHNQAFFAHAATGDKVLVYSQAKKAYLYRPSIDRIIEVAPLAPSSTPSGSTQTQDTQPGQTSQ
jgi:hypothetical protein